MSENQIADATAAKTTSRRRHPAGKAADADAVTTVAPEKVEKAKLVFQAVGRGGKVNRRTFTSIQTHAVDVSDPDSKSPAGKSGLIWSFHPSQEKAEAAAKRYHGKNPKLDCVVVEATPVDSEAASA